MRRILSGGRISLARMDLAAADRSYLWHPFTQQRGWASEDPVIIERGEGTDLIDVDGNRYIDGVSSLWCNVHGHAHPRIDAAVRDQLDQVAHSTMLGLSHRAAIELAQRLVRARAAGAHARLLLRLRLHRHGDRAEDGLPVLAPARAGPARPSSWRCGWPTTATRSARCRSAGSTCSTRSTTRCCSTRCKAEPGDAADMARAARRARGRGRGGDHGAAGAGRGRDARAPAGLPARGARAVRPPRRAADPRRGRHRLRPHRARCSPASTRASRPTCSASPRASPAATCRSPPRSRPSDDLRGLPRRPRGVPHLLPRPHLHGQPARLRGRARDARRLRARSARSSGCSRKIAPARRAARADRRARPAVGEVRRRGFMVGHRARRSTRCRRGWATGSRSRRAAAARSSARSATSSC